MVGLDIKLRNKGFKREGRRIFNDGHQNLKIIKKFASQII